MTNERDIVCWTRITPWEKCESKRIGRSRNYDIYSLQVVNGIYKIACNTFFA